ncbi:hypothetical protein DPMN_140687 [Dreissena polymorpha]|uniref:Uncharacterized protein n=1 Tax=Dreissena polymorpha TaxID=45954 RepID=A0A9D4GBB4_DREPO|nr:hypothetical protein DPMN_140687 [Dreissena polymorpha]
MELSHSHMQCMQRSKQCDRWQLHIVIQRHDDDGYVHLQHGIHHIWRDVTHLSV